jgi:hypothetical protein
MPDDRTLTNRIYTQLPSLAIIGAAAWALYTFVLKEKTKTHYIIPSIEVTSERKAEDGKYRAFELSFTVNNASEGDVYLIAGIVYAFGHTTEDCPDSIRNKTVNSSTHGPQLMMTAVTWGSQRDALGALVTFPRFNLARTAKATQQYVLLVPTAKYDILEIWAEFHLADACRGIYPLETCHELAVEWKWAGPERGKQEQPAAKQCEPKPPAEAEGPNTVFYYRKKGPSEPDSWKTISVEEMRRRFDYRMVQTTRMVVLPDAPILKKVKGPPPVDAPH